MLFLRISLPDPSDPDAVWRGAYIMIGVAIISAIIGLYSHVRKQKLKHRVDEVKRFIQQYSAKDPFWDENHMRKLGRDMFRSVMYAWSKNDFSSIGACLTPQLRAEWNEIWHRMKADQYEFRYEQIFIERVSIILAQDSEDNNKDIYSIEITGYVKRYLHHLPSGKTVPKHGNELCDFTDIYVFVRKENIWLLNEIKPDVKFRELFK